MRVLLCGYFGPGNYGDEVIRDIATHMLQQQGHTVSYTKLPIEWPANILGLYAKWRWGQQQWASVRDYDALVFPGGSVFQDETSERSLIFYTKMIDQAVRNNIRIILVGQGLGPIRKESWKIKVAKCLNQADYLSFRDSSAYDFAKQIGVESRKLHEGADTGWIKAYNSSTQSLYSQEGDKVHIVYAPRRVLNDREINFWYKHLPKNCLISLASFYPLQDATGCQRLAQLFGNQGFSAEVVSDPTTIIDAIQHCNAVIAERYHAVQLAAISNKPAYAICYDPKVEAIAKQLGYRTGKREVPWNIPNDLTDFINGIFTPRKLLPPDQSVLEKRISVALHMWEQAFKVLS